MTRPPRLLVVSHPAVLPVNHLVYARMAVRRRQADMVVPGGHEFGEITPTPLPALADGLRPSPVVLSGGVERAIRALAKCRADGAGTVLWVVGPGDEARFTALAAVLGVGDAVSFFERRSDTERFYGTADFFVFPSSDEAFSVAMLEAAAAGLPLIVPDINGVSELIGGGAAGIVVERNADSVAAALGALADPATRAQFGEEARGRAQHYTWERSAGTVVDLYRSLLPQEAR